MHQANLGKRIVLPVGIVLATMFVTSIIYDQSWKFCDISPMKFFITVTNILLFSSIFLSVFLIYPMMFFRGAGTVERVVASLIPLMVWIAKEIIRISYVFTVSESLYFGLNPVFIFLFCFALFQIGLSELICKWRLKKREGKEFKVLSAPTGIMFFGGTGVFFLSVIFFLHIFFLYFITYAAIFFN